MDPCVREKFCPHCNAQSSAALSSLPVVSPFSDHRSAHRQSPSPGRSGRRSRCRSKDRKRPKNRHSTRDRAEKSHSQRHHKRARPKSRSSSSREVRSSTRDVSPSQLLKAEQLAMDRLTKKYLAQQKAYLAPKAERDPQRSIRSDVPYRK